jgi:ribose-phosphate pyrophosphokinase
MKILNCNNTTNLVEKIISKIDLEPINKKITKFSDGELSIKIYDDLYQKAVLITHQLFPDVNENLMQLLFLINAVKRRGAKRIHVIIPYFAYSRMDHKAEAADFISASCIASLLESAGLDTLITIDLHSSQTEGFFRIPVKNITMLEVFQSGFGEIPSIDSVIVSPDIGGKLRTTSISKFLGAPLAVVYKQRDEKHNVSMNGIMGEVKGKHCILVDDMIGSGQTIMTAIDTLKSAQAKSIEIIITHNLLGAQDHKKFNDIASRVNKLSVSNSIQIDANKIYSSTINVVDISTSIIECINLYF